MSALDAWRGMRDAIVSAWLGDRDMPGSWEASYAPLRIAGDSVIATESWMA
jgi:hypothetical protein